MKSMTKLIVVAMILAAALVVTPVAAARDITANGTIVYVGEEDLNMADIFQGVLGDSGTLVRFSGNLNDRNVAQVIPVTNISDVDELTKTKVGTGTGTWHAFLKNADYSNSNINASGSIFIDTPSLSLDVLLGATGTTSVAAKSVTRGQDIRFQIQHNVGPLPNANVEVRVTTPGGGTVTTLEGTLLDVNLTSTTKNSTPVVVLKNATTGTYTAQGVWKKGTPLYDKGYSTNTITFEVASGALAITANKDTVVRNNAFTVTITGESEQGYFLNITTSTASGNTPPQIIPQIGVMTGSINADGTGAVINTTASGTRTIELKTNETTEAKTYNIKVSEMIPNGKDDEVKVKVEKGSVTITASGTGAYYIGEQITLSGTSTDSKDLYLFMTGPNLNKDGVNPENVTDTNPRHITVNADDTWSFKWDTGDTVRSIDAGSYTIYAASKNVNKAGLDTNVKYATVSVSLKSGFITATTSGATVAKGNDLTISGTAQGNPDNVFIWVFGKNYYGAKDGALYVRNPSVESDGAFKEDIDTKDLAAGQYFVVVQHPMGGKNGNAGSITVNTGLGTIQGGGQGAVNLTNLQAPAAASALINLLDSPNVPDTYVKLTFVVAEPNLFIDPIGTKTAGSKFTITGTTNLAVGDTLNIEVTSAAFQPGSKTDASAFSGFGGSAVVQKGDGANKWSFEVDATSFKPDQYIVKVESIEAETIATATFNVVAGGEPTTPPEGNVTTTTTTATTTTATTTTAATPTTTPGFGALVALAGLGAVAFLVLRRK